MMISMKATLVAAAILSGTAQAALVGVLPATPGGVDFQAYYDTVADLTWLADAGASGNMGWVGSNTWATSLQVNGISGWRMPTAVHQDGSCAPGTSLGICTGSEMGNLYYNVLGGAAGQSLTLQHNANYDLFTNIIEGGAVPVPYWTSTWLVNQPNTSSFYVTYFNGGSQNYHNAFLGSGYVWAVHDGNPGGANVPLPPALALLGSAVLALTGFIGRRRVAPLSR